MNSLVNIIFQTNNNVHNAHNVNNLANSFNKLQLGHVTDGAELTKSACNFMHTFYNKGGMMPLKEMKRNPEWKEEYREYIDIKKVQVCKYCNKKSLKGCCSNYSSVNRRMLTMVIGWSKK